jgi:hypothetical protein
MKEKKEAKENKVYNWLYTNSWDRQMIHQRYPPRNNNSRLVSLQGSRPWWHWKSARFDSGKVYWNHWVPCLPHNTQIHIEIACETVPYSMLHHTSRQYLAGLPPQQWSFILFSCSVHGCK